jgi:hypothetical protein
MPISNSRSKLFFDRSEICLVQVQPPVDPVRLHLKKMSILRIGPDRTETEPRLCIPGSAVSRVISSTAGRSDMQDGLCTDLETMYQHNETE